MQNVQLDHDRTTAMSAGSPSGRLTLPWSLLLLGGGYFLLVAGPLLTSRFAALRWVRDLSSGNAWLPAPAAAGTALLGAAALIFVVARLVRDVEQRPYASIAPVLAVFSGFVLTSTRTELPLPGVGAAQLGILVLSLALLGGVLIGRDSLAERALGWVLVMLPSFAVIAAVTATLGHADPITMLRGADPALRTHLMLLTVSSLCLGFVGAVARNLVRRVSTQAPALPFATQSRVTPPSGVFREAAPRGVGAPSLGLARSYGEPPIRMPRVQTRPSSPGYTAAPTQSRMSTLQGAPPPLLPVRMLTTHRVGPTSFDYGQASSLGYGHQTPVVSELAFDDPDLLLLTRRTLPLGRILAGLVVLAVAGAAGTYLFVVRPREQAAADLARVRTAPLKQVVPPAPRADEATQVISDTQAQRRELLERAGMIHTEPSVAPNVPVVTSLQEPEPTVSAPAEAASVLPGEERADKSRRRHRSHARRHHGAEASRPDESESPDESVTAHAPRAISAPASRASSAPASRASSAPAPRATPAVKPVQDEAELDLDQLLDRAAPKRDGVQAHEDPILGL